MGQSTFFRKLTLIKPRLVDILQVLSDNPSWSPIGDVRTTSEDQNNWLCGLNAWVIECKKIMDDGGDADQRRRFNANAIVAHFLHTAPGPTRRLNVWTPEIEVHDDSGGEQPKRKQNDRLKPYLEAQHADCLDDLRRLLVLITHQPVRAIKPKLPAICARLKKARHTSGHTQNEAVAALNKIFSALEAPRNLSEAQYCRWEKGQKPEGLNRTACEAYIENCSRRVGTPAP
jgi:hypothetical protein